MKSFPDRSRRRSHWFKPSLELMESRLAPAVTNQTTGDSFSTIQAAIDDADTLGNHVLLIDAGTYNENVNMTKGVVLRGATGLATDVVVNGGGGVGIRVGATGGAIEFLRVTGSSTGILADLGGFGGLALDHVRSDNNSNRGVDVSNGAAFAAGDSLFTANGFDNVHVESVGLFGLLNSSATASAGGDGVEVRDSGGGGFLIQGGSYSNNGDDSVDHGIELVNIPGLGIGLADVIVNGNAGDGVRASGAGLFIFRGTDITASANGNGGHGINVSDIGSVIIDHAVANNNDEDGLHHVNASADSTLNIDVMSLNNNGDNGIDAGGVALIELQSVSANANSFDGIHVDDFNEFRITIGSASNNGGDGLQLSNGTGIAVVSVSSFDGNLGTGIRLVQVSDTILGFVSANNNTGAGISASNTGVLRFSDVSADNNESNGMTFTTVGPVTFAGGVTALGNLRGVRAVGMESFSDTGGNYSGNDGVGLALTNVAGDVTLDGATASNNSADIASADVFPMDLHGIFIDQAGDVTFTDVTAEGNLIGISVTNAGAMSATDVTARESLIGMRFIGASFTGLRGAYSNNQAGLIIGAVGPIELDGTTANNNNVPAGVDGGLDGGKGIRAASESTIVFTNVTAQFNDQGVETVLGSSFNDVDGNYANNVGWGMFIAGITETIELDGTAADDNGGGMRVNLTSGLFADLNPSVDFTNVKARNNQSNGATVTGASSFRDTAGNFSGNGGRGLELSFFFTAPEFSELEDFDGPVTLENTVADNNGDADSGSGFHFQLVGAVEATGVSANGNARGLIGISLQSFSDTDGSYSQNTVAGIALADVAGDATLIRTVADNNNADAAGADEGFAFFAADFEAQPGLEQFEDADNLAIGGGLLVQGARFRGQFGASPAPQTAGVMVTGVGGTVAFENSGAVASAATGNTGDGIHISNVAGATSFSGGDYSNNGGDGIELENVGAVTFVNVTANGNDPGVFVNGAPSFSDTDGTFSNNNEHGIQLIDISGNVTLIRTTADNNDADDSGTGDGLNVTASANPVAIGGDLLVQGATFRDTGAAGDHQERGVFVASVAGAVTFESSGATPMTISGNEQQGVLIQDGGTTATFMGGSYSANGQDNLRLSSFSGLVSFTNVTSTNTVNGDGLELDGAPTVEIDGGSFSGNNDSGVELGNIAVSISVIGATVDANGDEGLDFDGPGDVAIAGGSFSGNAGIGIELDDVQAVVVTTAAASGNGDSGINVDTATTVALTGVTANGNGAFGFEVLNATVVDLTDLTLRNNNGAAGAVGGQITNVPTVNYIGSAAADTIALNAIQLQHTRAGDVQQPIVYGAASLLTLNGSEGDDFFNIHATNAVTDTSVNGDGGNDVINVSSNAPANTGHLDDIDGDLTIDAGAGAANRLIVSDFAGAANGNIVLLPDEIRNLAPVNLLYRATGGAFNGPARDGIRLVGSNNGADVFQPPFTLAGSSTQFDGAGGNDLFYVGSAPSADSGDLDSIRGVLSIVGGSPAGFGNLDRDIDPTGTRDFLYLNDRGDGLNRNNYIINTAAHRNAILTGDDTPRVFAGVFFDDTVDYIRFDGTDEVNVFDVGPSRFTQFYIDGNLPPPGDCRTGGGDFLRLDTTGTTGRRLSIERRGEGHWSFRSGHLDVGFESIERFNHVDILAVANDRGLPIVNVYDAETFEFKFRVRAYPSFFIGSVRVATGDVNCDGLPDLVTVPGPGRAALLNVFDGSPNENGNYGAAPLHSFDAFANDPSGRRFRHGAFVAVGDVNGDGANDIVASADARWQPLVRVFDGTSLGKAAPRMMAQFYAFPVSFRGGVRVAAGDLNGDGKAEIIAGSGSRAIVNIFNGRNFRRLKSFRAFRNNFFGGVFVAAGDFNGDGIRDVIVSADRGVRPRVRVVSGLGLFTRRPPITLSAFRAFPPSTRSGVRVAAKPADGGNSGFVEKVDIVLSSGPGKGAASRRVREARHNGPGLPPTIVNAIFESAVFNGIYVG